MIDLILSIWIDTVGPHEILFEKVCGEKSHDFRIKRSPAQGKKIKKFEVISILVIIWAVISSILLFPSVYISVLMEIGNFDRSIARLIPHIFVMVILLPIFIGMGYLYNKEKFGNQ